MLQMFNHDILKQEILQGQRDITIMLCVSGGCDSIALFHSFMDIVDQQQEDGSYTIPDILVGDKIRCDFHVVHFDHQQRGTSSDGDRLYVEKLCLQYDVPFYAYYWNDISQEEPVSKAFSQEFARDWRRNESLSLMKKVKNRQSLGMICTAHHRDDFEETMIMKMLRGVHITNISGMDVLTESKEEGIYFVKPLLNLRKRDLESFLVDNSRSWREDESNTSDKYLRNRVRNELLPLLQDIIGGESVLSRRLDNIQNQSFKVRQDVTSRAICLLNDMHQGTDGEFFILPDKLITLDMVQEEALFLWAKSRTQSNKSFSYDKIIAICDQITNYPDNVKWKLSVGEGWEVERNGSILKLNHAASSTSTDDSEPSTKEKWKVIEFGSIRQSKYINHTTVSIKLKLNPTINLTVKKSKDVMSAKFRPTWRNHEMKLTDFLRGQKIPLHLRGDVPVLCTEMNGKMAALAIFVDIQGNNREGISGDGKWHIHGDYFVTDDDIGIEYHEVELVLINE